MNKIAVVVLYFGKFPNYFPLWLRSCGYNKTIDFYVFTDADVPDHPENVIFVKTTLEDVRKRATNVLGFEAALSKPYKCCDYRPIYGLIFEDFLSKYDYWGHCDIDLVFGDIQSFFDKHNLYEYDKFGTLGHLSLIKNTPAINEAYTIQGSLQDYKHVYTTEENTLFDELCGLSTMMIEHGYKVFKKRIFADIATRYYRYRLIDVYPLDEKPINYPCQAFIWENGKTYHVYYSNGSINKEEYIYVHFQKRPNYIIADDVMHSDTFYITNKGFVPFLEEPTKEKILEMNPYHGCLYEKIERVYKEYKIRIKNRLK